eukprot:TRINITY_DN14869_c0_g1_i1.p1 TRINITY_DN14869_c0_g1~~TRINITY_DN14869_c0_g1_i1.p1  ORF type:complete len:257 (-),score=30.97 TRINITY_DN14869_c0_g1_i1:50-820(-)
MIRLNVSCGVLILLLCCVGLSKGQDPVFIDFNDSEIREILWVHNSLRAHLRPYTDNMPDLNWNAGLAQVWKNSPAPCTFQHTSNTYRSNQAGFTSVGENLVQASANLPLTRFLSGWGQERANYYYSPITGGGVAATGHYTQEIWATTTDVGCTRVQCGSSGYLIACNYGPAGNVLGAYPYILREGATAPPPEPLGSSSFHDTGGTTTKHLSGGAIAGIVIGVIIGFACIVGISAGIVIGAGYLASRTKEVTNQSTV